MKTRTLGVFVTGHSKGEVAGLQQIGVGLRYAVKAGYLRLSRIAHYLPDSKMGEVREEAKFFSGFLRDCPKVVGGRVDNNLGCMPVPFACMANERGAYAQLFIGLKSWLRKSYWNQRTHGGNSEDPTASQY